LTEEAQKDDVESITAASQQREVIVCEENEEATFMRAFIYYACEYEENEEATFSRAFIIYTKINIQYFFR